MNDYPDTSASTSTDPSDYSSSTNFVFREPAKLWRENLNIEKTELSENGVIYSQITKKAQKRVCFWDESPAASSTDSAAADNISDENCGDPEQLYTPSASPSKFPKTNPRFKIPFCNAKIGFASIRQLNNNDQNSGREISTVNNPGILKENFACASIQQRLEINNFKRPTSEMSLSSGTFSTDNTNDYERSYSTTSTDTTDSTVIDSQSKYNGSDREMRKILSGLKGFGIKGELYLNITMNRNLLTITVDEARNLIPPTGAACCSSYVRISLMPDEEKRTQCKTDLVPQSNRPVFNKAFTVELLPDDYEKRLLISLWHRSSIAQKSVFIGCMSFTVSGLVESNKQVDGWYFLLSPQYGKRKHLAVHKVTMLTYYGSVDSGINDNNHDPAAKGQSSKHNNNCKDL